MTVVVAHRGASAVAPENTMEAYRLAVRHHALELDAPRLRRKAGGIHDNLSTAPPTRPARSQMTLKKVRGQMRATASARWRQPFRSTGLKVPTDEGRWRAPDGIGLVEVGARAAAAPPSSGGRGCGRRAASLISFEEAISTTRQLTRRFPPPPARAVTADRARLVYAGSTATRRSTLGGDLGQAPRRRSRWPRCTAG
jgi:hypothetical protein